MSAWGANAKSCNALLDRVERNDPNLTELFILPTKNFGSTEVDRLAQILENGSNTNLRKLSASGHNVPNESLFKLGKAIASSMTSVLSSLAIGDNSMGHTGVLAFTKGLKEGGGSTRLEEIDLSWKGIGSSSFDLILKSFDAAQCPQLRILNLRRNENIGEIPDGGYSFQSISHIEQLDLSQCGISGDFLVKFFASLPGVPTSEGDERIDSNLLSLNLQENPINADGFKSLLPLVTNSSLQKLNVSKCQIDDEAIKCFRISNPAYENNLHLLDLSHNDLTSVGTQCLSLALESPNSALFKLQELNLAGNNLGDYGVQMLSDALEHRRQQGPPQTLEKLDLTDTNCGTKGAIEIITKGNLKSLHLFNNKLGSDGFIAVSTALTGGHATLESLDLGGNQANQAAVVVLLSALIEKEPQKEEVSTRENRLKLLVVGGNEGGDAVEQIAARIEQLYPNLDIARDKKAKRPEEP